VTSNACLLGRSGCDRGASGYQLGYQQAPEGLPGTIDCLVEVSEYLVGSPAFKAGVRGDPS